MQASLVGWIPGCERHRQDRTAEPSPKAVGFLVGGCSLSRRLCQATTATGCSGSEGSVGLVAGCLWRASQSGPSRSQPRANPVT